MGVTLARIFAQKGYRVTLWNRRTPSLDRAKVRIAGDLAALAARGQLAEPPRRCGVPPVLHHRIHPL